MDLNTKMKNSNRSSKPEEIPKMKVSAFYKVFFIDKSLIAGDDNNLRLERFYHPGKNGLAWFITNCDTNDILEVMEFCEPRRSWLIDSDICSNGKVYITTPIDVTFLALHQLKKHCANKALELGAIHDEQDSSVRRLMSNFIKKASLNCIADVKSVGDMTFYKYNCSKALAWLALKTKHLAQILKSSGIHCGRSALSQNYLRSEKTAEEHVEDDSDYLRMANDIVGSYLDLELHAELTKYLNIITMEANDENGKRKSLNTLKSTKQKKIKIDEEDCSNLKSNIIDEESFDEKKFGKQESNFNIHPVISSPGPLKERVLTAKQKKLAVGAKGTKSIASFFKK